MKPKLAAATVLGVLACAAGAATAPALTQAQAQATPVKHVVVLYLENHSFDSLLGFWCRQHRGRCPNGGMPASVTLSGGAVVKPRVKQEANNVPSDTFISDVQAGHLPNFALVIPGGPDAKYSEHNGFSTTAGDDWAGQIASAVMHGPLWRCTVLFITWDDCGCFYDQVPPGINPDGTQQGPRVPLVIVSPYARPGYTDTTATTYAGILAYVEKNFGLKPLGVNDAQAYPFTNAFNYSQTPLRPVKMVNRPVPRSDHIDWAAARQDT